MSFTYGSLEGFSEVYNKLKEKKERTPRYQSKMYNGVPPIWGELRKLNEFCDAALMSCDNKLFNVHRIVIVLTSPFFERLFTSNLNENPIKLTTFDAKSLNVIIKFAYTGRCKLTPRNVASLLMLSDRVQMFDFMMCCCDYIKERMNQENCIGLTRYANHFSCLDLQAFGRDYFLNNFNAVALEDEFLELSFNDLKDILSDDRLNASEEEVFEGIRIWVEKKKKVRMESIEELFNCMRFGLINQRYFCDNIIGWRCVTRNPHLLEYLNRIKCQIRFWGRDLTHPMSRPRVPREILFAIYGWSASYPSNVIETYDFRANRWSIHNVANITPRAYHFVTVVDNKIYMAGGFDGIKHFNVLSCFDPVTFKWTQKSVMHFHRCYISGCVQDRKIYAIGGLNATGRLSSVERYDVDVNQWTVIACMNKLRSDACACSLNGKIYVAGGFDGTRVISSVEFYDPTQEPGARWTEVAHMIFPRSGLSMVAHRQSLYVMGGYDGYSSLAQCEKYTPSIADERWIVIRNFYVPRTNFQSGVLNNKIYCVGGFDGRTGKKTIPDVECYDVDANTWGSVKNLNVHRSAMGVCVVSDIPNIEDFSYLSRLKKAKLIDPIRPTNHSIAFTPSTI